MKKTIVGFFVALGLILGASIFEVIYVQNTFTDFRDALTALYKKTEADTATHEDGNVVRTFWEERKKILHIFLPHTSLMEVDYHLNEALGYLYQNNFEDSLPKLELLLVITENIPRAYAILPENIF